MIILRQVAALSATVAAFTAASAGHAQQTDTATGNLRVQATVLSQCAVEDATLDFGLVSPAPPAQPPETEISAVCTAGLPYTVGIGIGENAQSGQRRMRRTGSDGSQPGDYLSYDLYKDVGLANRWGEAVLGEQISIIATGSLQTAPVYSKLAASGPAAGNFVDNAAITLHF